RAGAAGSLSGRGRRAPCGDALSAANSAVGEDLVRSFRFPLLNGLYRLDRGPGLEIVVTTEEGAANSLELFAVRSGRLLRLGPRLAGSPDGTILWGGSALAS